MTTKQKQIKQNLEFHLLEFQESIDAGQVGSTERLAVYAAMLQAYADLLKSDD